MKIIEENLTTDISYYAKYKNKLDKATYQALIDYLSLYKKNDIRFDTLITALLEDVLDNMCPDTKFLSTFKASSQKMIEIRFMVPSVVSYAKYSFYNGEKIFSQYVSILNKLVLSLKRNGYSKKIAIEATKYSRLTHLFLNKTVPAPNLHNVIKFNDYEVKLEVESQSNVTLLHALMLFDLLDKFQDSIEKERNTNPNFLDITMDKVTIIESIKVMELLNEIAKSEASKWDSLINFGFWYITNKIR